MNTLEQMTISGFELNAHPNHLQSELTVKVGGVDYSVCQVRRPSWRPSRHVRLSFLIPIESASHKLQMSLATAYDDKTQVSVKFGDCEFSGKLDRLPGQGIHASVGRPSETVDTFSFSLQAEPPEAE